MQPLLFDDWPRLTLALSLHESLSCSSSCSLLCTLVLVCSFLLFSSLPRLLPSLLHTTHNLNARDLTRPSAPQEFKDRSKPLFLIYRKGARLQTIEGVNTYALKVLPSIYNA